MKLRFLLVPGLALFVWLALGAGLAARNAETSRQVEGKLEQISATSARGFRDALIGFCRENRLDSEKAPAALTDATYVRAIDQKLQEGVAAGIRRTPTVVVAGKLFVETVELDERVLDALLESLSESQ